jgi:hypothetical protein
MWVLAATAWIGVVIVGSALTWLAIDRAGQQVTSSSASANNTQPAVVGTIGAPPVASSTPSKKPSRKPSDPGSSSPSPVGQPSTAAPTRTPTKNSDGSTTEPPTARTELRTWSGVAGSVTVSCTGGTVRFKGASPSDGWHVERGDDSGDSIEVKFEKDEAEVQVRATCVSGVPRFQVETSGRDD